MLFRFFKFTRVEILKLVFGSFGLFSCLSDGSSDQFGIDSFDLWDLLDDLGDCVFLGQFTVDWVSNEEDSLDVLEGLQLGELIPRLDPVVGHQEGVELNAWLEVELLDLVVGDPELFKGLANVFETLESSYVVAAKGHNFEVLKAGKGDHLLDGVCGKRELGDVLELIE